MTSTLHRNGDLYARFLRCDARSWKIHGRVAPKKVLTAIAAVTLVVSLAGSVDLVGDCMRGLVSALASVHDWMGENPWLTLALSLIAGLLYALLLCLPFVPAIELGLALMVLGGTQGAVVVYLSTVVGLALAFAAGRRLRNREAVLYPALRKLQPMSTNETVAFMAARLADRPWAPYLLTGFMINCPGNSLVGGGGGIAIMSGYSRAQTCCGFLITVAIATAPVPLLVIAGTIQISNWQ